tara:strand:- start:380 stop:700 length:321 start_codon:yes stop_codon:yes gene_type:complete
VFLVIIQYLKLLPQLVVAAVTVAQAMLLQEDQVEEVQLDLQLEDQVMPEVFHHRKEITEEQDLHLVVRVKVAAAEAAARVAQAETEHLLHQVVAEMEQQIQLQVHQ